MPAIIFCAKERFVIDQTLNNDFAANIIMTLAKIIYDISKWVFTTGHSPTRISLADPYRICITQVTSPGQGRASFVFLYAPRASSVRYQKNKTRDLRRGSLVARRGFEPVLIVNILYGNGNTNGNRYIHDSQPHCNRLPLCRRCSFLEIICQFSVYNGKN